mgnify:CR=1 FL=1
MTTDFNPDEAWHDSAQSDVPPFLHAKATTDGIVLSFEVADAKAAYAKAQQQELDIHFELKEESWQQIHFMIRDPAGLILDIVEDRN